MMNLYRYLTSQPHVAGTNADFEQADYLKKLWTQQGLDQVTLSPYQVLLSFPHAEKSSKVS
jgi:N-acetylated-alpha-linked acidic dipeptidase